MSSAALLGCQPNSTVAPLSPAELPTALSESYRSAFAQNPGITSQRFLHAYDEFAEGGGPVTKARVEEQARLQRALQRGKLLSYILAIDINGDAQITRQEFEEFEIPKHWSSQLLGMSDLFAADDNQDDIISIQEAILHSRDLHSRSTRHDMRPIEDYFMLSDANGDEVVTRSEIITYLYAFIPGEKTARGRLPRG